MTRREIAGLLERVPFTFFALSCFVSQAQKVTPDHFGELKYPPIARVARVQGDVIVSFRRAPNGTTLDVKPVSGPPLLQAVAVENVRGWQFDSTEEPGGKTHNVTFHFQLDPPAEGYDTQPTTKVELDGVDGVRIISILTTGLQRSECPSSAARELPPAVIAGDFVEVDRWNESVRIAEDGSIIWKSGEASHEVHVTTAEVRSVLEQFRSQAIWDLCASYDQAGLMDGKASSLEVRVGGREKRVREYGDAAPSIFRDMELRVDQVANTHQWRHGDPQTESIVEITHEDLPKPGKTKLMDAAHRGDEAGVQAALAAGEMLTDTDASGWTPLMYAASSYNSSLVSELLNAGAKVNARSKRGETALMAAAVTGMADEDLLDAGADVNAVNDVGMTALMLLVQRAEPDEIKTLLRTGANAREKDGAGRTALDYLNAANCGRPIVEAKDPQWMTIRGGYSRCNGLNGKDYRTSKQLLIDAGSKRTRAYTPK